MKRALAQLIILFLAMWVLVACQLTPTPELVDYAPTNTSRPLSTMDPALNLRRPTATIEPDPSPTVYASPTPAPPIKPPPSAEAQEYPYPYPISTPTFRVTPSSTPTQTPSRTPTRPPSATPTRAHPVYAGPPLSRSEVGLQVHIHQEDISRIASHLRVLGVGWVKVQISWKLYEPNPGRYDEDRFDELDHLVTAANDLDIYLLLSVAKAPEWSRPTTELDGPPSDYGRFQEFMNYLASRYQGRVAAYELWNEPNLMREWNGVPLSAADCVRLIRRGAAGVRVADPLAILVSAPPATTGINDYVNAIDDRVYLREMLLAGLAGEVDAIGAHPYGWANPPDASAADPQQTAFTHNNHPSFFFRDTLWDYFSILNEYGHSEMQVWVTEFGWGSFDQMGSLPPEGAEFMAAVSEWQQATYILQAYELAHQWRWVGPLFLWNLNFAPLLGTDFSESGYSLLRPDGSPRPSYLAFETMEKE